MLRHKLIHSLVLSLFFLIAGSASAQVYTVAGQIRDHQGNVVPAATVIVLSGNLTTVNTATQPGSPLATIYSDPAGTMVINQTSNPVTTNGLGQFVAYAAPGNYVIQSYRNGFQLVSPVSITTNGTGCTVAGSAGDLQKNSGSGTCSASHINDSGTVLHASEPFTGASINGIIYIDGVTYSQTDIGAGINAATAGLSPGYYTVQVPPSATCYSQATPINFATSGVYVTIQGPACFKWTGSPTSASPAITYNDGPGTLAQHPRAYGLRDIQLIGPNGSQGQTGICTSVSGVTVNALLLGGSNGAEGFQMDGGGINCFGTALKYGNNTWQTLISHTIIRNSTKDLDISGSIANTGEALVFDNVSWIWDPASAPTCVVNISNTTGSVIETEFKSNSFDGAQLCAGGIVRVTGASNFENSGNNMLFPFINNSGALEMIGPTLLEDFGAAFSPSEFIENNSVNGVLIIHGLNAAAGSTLSYFVGDANNAATQIDGLMTGTFTWSNWINHTGTGTYLIDGFGTASQLGDFASSAPVIYREGLRVPDTSNGTFGTYWDVPSLTGGEVGLRNMGTPDTLGGYTSKILNARCTVGGVINYNSEQDFYTELKSAANTNDTSTVTGVSDCFGDWEGNAFVVRTIPNNTSTGTLGNGLVSLSGGQAIRTSGGATSGVVGVAIGNSSGSSTSGNVIMVVLGSVSCSFDGSVTQNDYVQISSTAGDCHDTGSSTPPTSGQILGTVLNATASGAGTYSMYFNPSGAGGGSGGAFSGGLGTSYQDVTEIAAPSNPASGNDRLYLNSSTHLLSCLTSSGGSCTPAGSGSVSNITGDGYLISNVSSTGAVTLSVGAAAAHSYWGNNTGSSTTPAYHQPSFSDLSGSNSCPQLPALTGDATTSAGSCATSVVKVNGAAIPTSASALGSNSSNQLVADTAHNIITPLACTDSSGSGTAQSCSTSPTFTPAVGDQIVYKTTTSNTGDVTINANSAGAAHVRKWLGSSTLASGDLPSNVPELLTWDGSYWEVYTIGNVPSGGGSGVVSNCSTLGGVAYYATTGTTVSCLTNAVLSAGQLALGVAGTTQGAITLAGSSSGVVTIQPAGAAGTWTWTMPNSGGTANYFMQTNGSGVSTWAQPSFSELSGINSAAAGGTGQNSSASTGIPYVTAGAWAFSNTIPAAAIWNGTVITVPYGGSGAATFTNHGPLFGSGTSAFGVGAVGTLNQPMLSGGASANGAYGNTPVIGTAGVYGIGAAGTADTGLSRDSAGVVDAGNGTAGDTSGEVQATIFHTVGTNGGISFPEGTGGSLTPDTSHDILYGNSTSQRFAMNNHNTGVVYLMGIAAAATPNDCPKFGSNGYDVVDSGAGCGGLSGLTTSYLLKATSSSTAGNSSISDNASTVATPEPVAAGTGAIAVYTTQLANQNVEVGSGNGSGSDGGTGNVTLFNAMLGGTTFTASGCSNSTLVGGAQAGSFHSGTSGTCTVTITMGNSATAPHGWSCWANDITTPADVVHQTGGNTTTAILSGTTVSGDVVNFGCLGY